MDYTFELNNARKDSAFASGKVNSQSPVVEIFSAMVDGKDLSKYGAKADVAANYIKELGEKAQNNDFAAMAELNEIRKFAMQPKLLQEIKLLKASISTPVSWWLTWSAEVRRCRCVSMCPTSRPTMWRPRNCWSL